MTTGAPGSSSIEVRAIDVLDPAQDAEAEAWAGIHHEARRHAIGDEGGTWTLPEIRAAHRSDGTRGVTVGAWLDGELVGALEVVMPLRDNQGLASLWLSVAPDARRRGVGSALCAAAERIARENRRTILSVRTVWAGERDEAEEFARGQGYDVGLTEVRGALALADTGRLRRIGHGEPADDYLLESFVDEMPGDWLEDRAVLQQRMSTDMPLGELALEEEPWDVARLREELTRLRATGRRVVETVARHRPSGRLVGFTRLTVGAEDPTLARQEETLVLHEHRGHRLGLRLKAANALVLLDVLPEARTIRTWNAADNVPMLAVNRELGYVVDGHARQWQKFLS